MQKYLLCGMCLPLCRLMLLFIALTLFHPGAINLSKKTMIPEC